MKFRAALGFFTRLPVGSAPLPPTFQGVIVWLPAIGLIVGLLAALAVALATLLLPAQLGGVIGCLVWVFITGGLHLDGVADCGDGLLVEAPPERRLEIMKDSRLGTFGGAALFFVLALKATALCTLAASFDGKLERPPHPCGSLLHGRSTGAKHGLSGDARPLSPTGGPWRGAA